MYLKDEGDVRRADLQKVCDEAAEEAAGAQVVMPKWQIILLNVCLEVLDQHKRIEKLEGRRV